MPAAKREAYAAQARTAFDGLLPAANVQCEGQILLGTPTMPKLVSTDAKQLNTFGGDIAHSVVCAMVGLELLISKTNLSI